MRKPQPSIMDDTLHGGDVAATLLTAIRNDRGVDAALDAARGMIIGSIAIIARVNGTDARDELLALLPLLVRK
jgi:hypothetical protein